MDLLEEILWLEGYNKIERPLTMKPRYADFLDAIYDNEQQLSEKPDVQAPTQQGDREKSLEASVLEDPTIQG